MCAYKLRKAQRLDKVYSEGVSFLSLKNFPSSGLPWKAPVTFYCEYLITPKLKVKERGGLESVYGQVLSKEPEYTTWKVPGHGIGHFTTIN